MLLTGAPTNIPTNYAQKFTQKNFMFEHMSNFSKYEQRKKDEITSSASLQ